METFTPKTPKTYTAELKKFYRYFFVKHFPPRVSSIDPDLSTFCHYPESPIWVRFDQTMDPSTFTKDTVIVEANGELVNGTISLMRDSRILFFRPSGSYKKGSRDTTVIITLIGTDKGSGAIKSAFGIPLDGDDDGQSGGDFVYEFNLYG